MQSALNNTRQLILPRRLQSQLAFVFVCANSYSFSGMQLLIKVKTHAMVHPGSTLVWFLVCEFLAGHSICDEELGQFKISTIKIAGQVCVAFRACGARAAACEQ